MTRGNTNADTANAKFDVAHLMGDWKHSFGMSGLYSRTTGITTAESWEGHWQTDRQLTPHTYWFASAHYEDDEFSGFAYQESLTTGLGHDFLSSQTNKLSIQLGAGARRLRPEVLIRNDIGAVIERDPLQPGTEAVAQAGVNFTHDFTSSTKITDNVIVEYGASNTMTRNNLALQVQMSSSLALSIGYEVDNNSSPPVGARSTDKITTLNFVYDLKNPKLSPTPGATMKLPPPPPPPAAPPPAATTPIP
jgi:putative salt-induced outer membrane protein